MFAIRTLSRSAVLSAFALQLSFAWSACELGDREPEYPSAHAETQPAQYAQATPPSQQPYAQPGQPYSAAQPAPQYAEPNATFGATDASAQQPPYDESQGAVEPSQAEDTDPAAVATFQPALAPYGTWYDDPTYGTIWVPSPTYVGIEFTPYVTGGHWAYTDDGYYWASSWDWFWAPFHYGRWCHTYYGWSWIPGARYASAWVDWRYGAGYVGWAPTPPSCYWHGGVAVPAPYAAPVPSAYVFVPTNQIFAPHPHAIAFSGASQPTIYAATRVYTAPDAYGGAHVFRGPDPAAVGIPQPSLQAASMRVPEYVHPESIPWRPTPQSRIAPPRSVAAAPIAPVTPPRLPSPSTPTPVAPQVVRPTPVRPASPPVYAPPATTTIPATPPPRIAPMPAPHPYVAPTPTPMTPPPRIAPMPAPRPYVAPTPAPMTPAPRIAPMPAPHFAPMPRMTPMPAPRMAPMGVAPRVAPMPRGR
jgi:hypothetical protein